MDSSYDCQELMDYINGLASEEVYDAERGNAILLAISETTIQGKPIEIEEMNADSITKEASVGMIIGQGDPVFSSERYFHV